MDLYYHSKLADKIHQGVNGVQYLEQGACTDLGEIEPGFFTQKSEFV